MEIINQKQATKIEWAKLKGEEYATKTNFSEIALLPSSFSEIAKIAEVEIFAMGDSENDKDKIKTQFTLAFFAFIEGFNSGIYDQIEKRGYFQYKNSVYKLNSFCLTEFRSHYFYYDLPEFVKAYCSRCLHDCKQS